MTLQDRIEYFKAYLRTMAKSKFDYIINLLATFTGITLVLINPTLYICLALISATIATIMYYRKER